MVNTKWRFQDVRADAAPALHKRHDSASRRFFSTVCGGRFTKPCSTGKLLLLHREKCMLARLWLAKSYCVSLFPLFSG
jgi:hypothetical protein